MNQSTTTERPIAALIKKHQQLHALTDEEISAALGYQRTNVICQIKAGQLMFPIGKVLALAKILDVDPVETFQAAIAGNPELLAVIEQIFPLSSLTPTEQHLILHLRKVFGDIDCRPVVFDGKAIIALVTVT